MDSSDCTPVVTNLCAGSPLGCHVYIFFFLGGRGLNLDHFHAGFHIVTFDKETSKKRKHKGKKNKKEKGNKKYQELVEKWVGELAPNHG
jgi:hypothetical protein